MFALVLACALLGQTLSAPSPSNCGTICDHTTGHQVLPGGQTTGGYSNYRKWGSSSSWSSGNVNSGYGSSSSVPARLEDLDEGNVIGLERPSGNGNNGNWRDEKSYVTNDGKGKINYKAEQSVTGNSFRKYAESSYNYGSDAQHQPQPNSQIISPTQFEPRVQDVQRDMDAFIGRFSFAGGSSSSVNQHTLDIFKQQAQQLTNQLTSLCDRADSSSDEYRRLQAIQRQFDQQVQQKQQEIMNFVYDRQEHYSGSVTSSSGIGSSSYVRPSQYHPQVTPTYRYPPQQPQPTVNPQAAESERLQQECNQLRGNIDAFYKNFVVADLTGYTREDSLRDFQSQVNTEVAAINQQIANLRLDTANFEYQRKFVEDMHRTFERYVQNLNDHLQDCERRIKAEQLRLLQEQERLEEERLQRERAESQRKYDEQVRIAEENHKREQALIQERLDIQRRQEQEERMRIEQRRQPAILLPEVQPLPPRQQQQQQQVTITPNVEVTSNSGGSYTSSFHVSGSQRHEVSGSSSSGGQVYQQPMQYGPHVDIVDINNKMNQEFNRLLSSVSGLSSYSMQLTESNHESVNAQFQREFENLRRKIEGLCQQSSQYHNERVLQAAEELKQSLERSLQYFQEECDKVSNAAATSSGSSWGSSGRYTHTRQPHIANVEISHSKSTEIEVTHGGGRGANGAEGQQQQQVICVEQYADQPCLEPVRVRREAGGYYSQQRDSGLDEYKPRRNTYQRRRTFEPEETEDYSQQHVDPQRELDEYSQRTGQVEVPRYRQTGRGENYRRHGETQGQVEQQENHYSQRNQNRRPYGSRYRQQENEDSQQYVQSGQNEDLQSYQRPRGQRTEDLSQQSGQSEDLQSYQKPRGQRVEDLSQQSGQSEDLQSYQKPRGQRVEDLSQQSGQSEDLQSYQKPRGQRVEDLSQQSGQSEDLQSYQKPRGQRVEDMSQQSGQSEDLQSYQKPRGQRVEDMSQQSGQSEDLQSYQKPRGQRVEDLSQQSGQNEDRQSRQRPRGQRIENSSQQYVQSGQNEDSQSYQRPRHQRIEVTPNNEQNSQVDDLLRGTQRGHAANLQREQSSASTGRTLLDQRLVVDEPQEFVKPIVKPGKAGSARGVDDYSLEQSGFYDNPKSQENSKLNDNLQQSYERASQTIETHGKSSEEMQKPRYGDLTLENSGFDDYQSQRGQHSVTERPSEQVTTFKDLTDSQKSEDLTLQQSGFFDQQPRGSVSQQRNDSTQQSAEQTNFGPEFQAGRRSPSSLRPERIDSYQDDVRRGRTQNREYESRNEHPVGQYMHNLPQQNVPSSVNIIDLEDNGANGQFDNANSQSDKILPLENQESSVTAYPPVRQAPKPNPRYTRPGQYSPNTVPQNIENEYVQQSANQNTNIGSGSSSLHSDESNKPSEPHRGDLPGISEPITEEPVYIPPASTPAPIVRPTTQAPSTEAPRQEIVPDVPTERTPCVFNRCQQNQFDQLGQSYYYRQQHQQNIRFSQQSTYNGQQNIGINSGYQNPFYQNSQVRFDQQVSPVNHVQDGGYTFSYRGEQRNHLRVNHQGSAISTAPTSLEQSDLLGLNRQESSQQHVQPSFENSSGQREFTQHHSTFTFNQQRSQTADDEFPAEVIPLDETQSRNLWNNMELTTRPTFWKRVGHKLSNAYEKVKESARTVYG